MLNGFLASVITAGRDWINRHGIGSHSASSDIVNLCRELMSTRGEASGVALACEIIAAYQGLDQDAKGEFFTVLLNEYGLDSQTVLDAAQAYHASQDPADFHNLMVAAEPRRQELLRRVNMAPGGTEMLVGLRCDLLDLLKDRPGLRPIDDDLRHLLSSWFNRGFLRIERIDWRSSAMILEKTMAYESVHRMRGWEDLRRRLGADRRCFAFFHPALPDEPLIFVHVALVRGLAGSVDPLLDPDGEILPEDAADTAIFYSINNCQRGLLGISFGDLLIKQVVLELRAELPGIKTFSTLSPIPGFSKWLRAELKAGPDSTLSAEAQTTLAGLAGDQPDPTPDTVAGLETILTGLCAHYLLEVRKGLAPRDPVARFHLRNGARLHRINWLGDRSPAGLGQSAGMLVNYVYDPDSIERNHESFVLEGRIDTSPAVKQLLEAARGSLAQLPAA